MNKISNYTCPEDVQAIVNSLEDVRDTVIGIDFAKNLYVYVTEETSPDESLCIYRSMSDEKKLSCIVASCVTVEDTTFGIQIHHLSTRVNSENQLELILYGPVTNKPALIPLPSYLSIEEN